MPAARVATNPTPCAQDLGDSPVSQQAATTSNPPSPPSLRLSIPSQHAGTPGPWATSSFEGEQPGQAHTIAALGASPRTRGQRGNKTGHGPAIATAAAAVLRTSLVMDGVPGGGLKRGTCPRHMSWSPGELWARGHGAHPHLHNDSEEHHHDGRRHKVVLSFHLRPVQQNDQGEGHGSAEAAV